MRGMGLMSGMGRNWLEHAGAKLTRQPPCVGEAGGRRDGGVSPRRRAAQSLCSILAAFRVTRRRPVRGCRRSGGG